VNERVVGIRSGEAGKQALGRWEAEKDGKDEKLGRMGRWTACEAYRLRQK